MAFISYLALFYLVPLGDIGVASGSNDRQTPANPDESKARACFPLAPYSLLQVLARVKFEKESGGLCVNLGGALGPWEAFWDSGKRE